MRDADQRGQAGVGRSGDVLVWGLSEIDGFRRDLEIWRSGELAIELRCEDLEIYLVSWRSIL